MLTFNFMKARRSTLYQLEARSGSKNFERAYLSKYRRMFFPFSELQNPTGLGCVFRAVSEEPIINQNNTE